MGHSSVLRYSMLSPEPYSVFGMKISDSENRGVIAESVPTSQFDWLDCLCLLMAPSNHFETFANVLNHL